MPITHRPRFGRWLCCATWAVCAVVLASELKNEPLQAFRVLPWLAVVSLLVWAAYWNPRVSIDDGGVHLVNVLRTIDLPWPTIQRIDTKWALMLVTAYGSFTAWAAPAPGAHHSIRLGQQNRRAGRWLPESTISDGSSIRPGDLPGSASGDAALAVRRRWEQLRDAGYLDQPQVEFDRPPITWHWPIIGAIALLLVCCALTFI